MVRRVAPGARLVRVWEPRGGVSAQVTAFEVEHACGRTEKLVVRRHGATDLKRNPNIAADEFRLLEVLQSCGVPAPRPRYLDAPGQRLVVDYLDGAVDAAPAGHAEFLGPFTTVLAEIHRVAIADLSFLPERRLTDVPVRRCNPPVLLHGDFWPGNVLWEDGRLVAVLDWEDAAIGDPLADVANARLELLWAGGAEAKEEFTRRYRSLVPGVDLTDLPHWDRWAGLRLAGFEPAKR